MAANKIPSHQTEDVLQEIRTRKAEVKSQIKESADFIKTTSQKIGHGYHTYRSDRTPA